MNPKTDIDRLAREANDAIAAADHKRSQPRPRSNARRRVIQSISTVLLLLPLMVLQAHFAWVERLVDHAFPARALQRGQADMKAILGVARAAVESERSRLGSLPDALPSAALAALVQYDRNADSYRLSMSVGKSTASVDGDGVVDFQTLTH